MYSSGGDLHLELPTGQQGGTGKLWVSSSLFKAPMQIRLSLSLKLLFFLQEIPPFETKGVMRASFSSRDVDNHTAYIRIKTNAPNEDQFIILPVEVEVTSGVLPKNTWAKFTHQGQSNKVQLEAGSFIFAQD